jgi:hypothetical protein
MIWVQRHRSFRPEMLGIVPSFLDEADPRDAKTQLDAGYHYGGFWMGADQGVRLGDDDAMLYPDDPPQPVLAEARLRDERILFYPGEFVGVVAADGSFAVQRMD